MPDDLLILCIGNRHGGDDAIGPYVYDRLHTDAPAMRAVDCGTTPENYTTTITQHQPRTVLLIDAVDMGLPPGELRIVPREKLGSLTISTHGMPLAVLMQYLEQNAPHVILIGIQPKHLSGRLSSTVKKSADHLIEMLKTHTYPQLSVL
jgi:hydrogenase 3 maturation protease